MEFALPELLSRDDILKILDQRQLHIHNMNELTHDELLRVYKTFVLPLTKRPERIQKIKQIHRVSTNKNYYEDHSMQVEPLDNVCNTMDMDINCVEEYNVEPLIRSSDRIDSPLGEKRRQRSSDEDIMNMFESDYQYQLSSVTKRIRINTLS